VDTTGGGQVCPSFGGIADGVGVTEGDDVSLSDSLFVLSNLIELFFEISPT